METSTAPSVTLPAISAAMEIISFFTSSACGFDDHRSVHTVSDRISFPVQSGKGYAEKETGKDQGRTGARKLPLHRFLKLT